MPRQYTFEGHTFTVPDNATMDQVQDYVRAQGWAPAPSTDPSGRTPTGEPAPNDTRNGVQRYLDNLITPDPRREEWQTPFRNGVDDFAQHVASNVVPLISHPLDSAKGMLKSVGTAIANGQGSPTGVGGELLRPLIEKAVQDYQAHGPVRGTTDLLGTGAGALATGELGGELVKGIPKIASAVRSAAIGDPDVAAIRAAGLPKKAALGFKADVQAARPYLTGAKSVEDVQNTAGLGGTARDEIYKPISDFLAEHGNRIVQGPDGPTTLGNLEAERAQVSAQLRQLKAGGPEGIALATQKGLTQADLLARQQAIEGAMDPHFMGAGIDSPLIRQTYGQVARVGDEFSGRLTDAEKPTPYGFGRMLNMRIDNPRSWFGVPAQGARDLLAGHPLWSGNAGDVGVADAFRSGGPKPDFRAPVSAMPAWENSPRLLQSDVPGNAPYGEEPYPGSMNGMRERNPVRVTPSPSERPLLPASTQGGEPQPMIRYATPYSEPYDPGLRPFSPPEYLAPAKPYQPPIITKPLLPAQGAQ